MKNWILCPGKIRSILWLLVSLLYSSGQFAQVVYTDIPDATPGATYALDLNNDLVDDFLIQFDFNDKIMCKPLNGNAYSGEFSGGLHLPWCLSESSNICDTLYTWYDNSNPGIMAWGEDTGYWAGQTDKYLALKLIVGPDTHFGWARLDILPASTSFTIKDYAYESSPNTCIRSGQVYLSLNENVTKGTFALFPNPVNVSATINTNYELKNATLKIFNSSGHAIIKLDNIYGQVISVPVEQLKDGIYLIQLIENDLIISVEKFVKMR